MSLNIDRVIRLSFGLGLGFITISGLRCINQVREDTDECKCPEESGNGNGNTLTCSPNKKCSKMNMNLGLGMLGVASGLLVYRNYRIFH